MKILYDHQIFTMQQWGGISRYFSELIKEMSADPGVNVEATVKFSTNKYLYKFNHSNINWLFSQNHFPGKPQIQGFLNRIISQQIIKKGNFDLFHPTYYNPYYLSGLPAKPMVVTVYDMIHERMPHYFSEAAKISENKKMAVKRADKVIAISQNTKLDLIELFDVPEEKIDVIHLGNSLNYDQMYEEVDIGWLPETYILFVGIRSAYKNFEKFIKSAVPLLHEDDNLHLICVGGGDFQASENAFFTEQNLSERIHQISCTDSELAYLYKNARCFVFPSLYEGFGLPVLEAFSADCPVACSNCSSLPEVAEDAAVYFNPNSEIEIRKAVRKLIYDDELRESLIQKGTERAKQFSWKRTAHQTKEVYESVL